MASFSSSSAGAVAEQGLGLSWQDVSWHARVGPAERQVLHSLSGHSHPGQVTALMGPSGSGKTTLLDILAMRKTLGRVEGSVLIDGCDRRPGGFQRASAYIPSEDALLPTLTVGETMHYYAEMRMPPGTSSQVKSARVEEVLKLVGLQKAMRTSVGGALPGGLNLRGLSGGEKRRLSIAAAMLPQPSVVFADEPTSGLDALASLKVLQVFKDVADTGKIVLVTVHQPRAAIWQLFSRLYLLSEGRLMYSGPPTGAVPWFESLGYYVGEESSPADWLLDLVTTGFDKSQLGWKACSSEADVAEASAKFAGGEAMRGIEREIEAACGGHFNGGRSLWPRTPDSEGAEASGVRWLRQLRTLLWRHVLNYSRNVGNVAARLCLALASGLVVGLCYSGLRVADETDPRLVVDRLGACFFMCIVLMICPNCTMSLFVADRRFYIAESAAQLYGPLAYYLPMALCELVLNVAAAALFWTPVWALSGMLAGIRSFLGGLLLCSLVQLCGAQIVNFSALLLPNQEIAFVLSVALNIFSFITCGFLVKTEDLVGCVRWLRWLSPVKLGLQGLALNEIGPRSYGSDRQLEELRSALQLIGSDAEAPAWWLRQSMLRGLAGHALEEALPCVDPCLTGMVRQGSEALACLGLQEPSTIAGAVLGLLAQLAALHFAGWLCLRNLQKERR